MQDQDQQHPHIETQPVESSQLHGIGYDAATRTLAIRFKNKAGEPTSLYHYANVSPDQFEAFRGAESIGSHFIRNFKSAEAHPYTRISG